MYLMQSIFMLISLLISLLVSNDVTLRRDKSILFSRIVITGLFFASFLALNNLFTKALEKGIGIYGGLFNVTTLIQSFNISNITINSALSSTISVLTFLLILFIYIPGEWFNIVSILSLILFKT